MKTLRSAIARTLGTGVLSAFTLALIGETADASTLMLTPEGMAAGFTLTTFATINPTYANTYNYGPFGLAVTANGNVLVSNYPNDVRYVFANVDGQTVASALNTITSSGSSTVAYTTTVSSASTGGQAYGGVDGRFVQFNNDGTVNHVLTGVTPGTYLGMAGNPADGHILASSSAGIIDIDPAANSGTGSFRVVVANAFGDGVSVSPDGKTVYFEQGSINGYDIATGKLVYTSGLLFNSPDGTGVIASTNNLNGDIIVNNNNGEIDLLDPNTNKVVAIAKGGTRGDYTSSDPFSGTLLLDYSDIVARLSCGPNCSIGTPIPSIPEPSTFGLMGLSLVTGLFALIRRKA